MPNTELAYWIVENRYRVRIDAATGRPVGESRVWFTDPGFNDTLGESHVATPDGGVIYVRGPERTTASYVRVFGGGSSRCGERWRPGANGSGAATTVSGCVRCVADVTHAGLWGGLHTFAKLGPAPGGKRGRVRGAPEEGRSGGVMSDSRVNWGAP